MSHPPYRVASRWAIYDPGGMLVYVASTHEERPETCIADCQRQGYRCIRVYVTPLRRQGSGA